jgi:HK97 family phage prohead protease
MGGRDMDMGSSALKKFRYEFEIHKAVASNRLIVYGVASTQTQDRDGETVSMKSLDKAFQRYMRRSPVILYNHSGDHDAVGKVIPEFMGEDGTIYKSGIVDNKLYVVAEISTAQSASDVRIQINEGILSSFSIGGRARRVRKNAQTTVMIADLYEISIVPIPANEETLFSVVHKSCVGSNCPVDKSHIMEVNTMEKEEIITLIKGVLDESRTESEMTELRQHEDRD